MHHIWALAPQQSQSPYDSPEARQDPSKADPIQCHLGDPQAELVDVRTVINRTAVARYHGDTVAITALRAFKAEDCTRISPDGLRIALRYM
jgi:hypothetical protein